MIFASTPPRNTDPTPHVSYHGTRQPTAAPMGPCSECKTEYKPRPWFDQPRAHEANPILVDLRKIYVEFHEPHGITLAETSQDWLDLLAEDPAMKDPKSWGDLVERATSGHIAHARRVLVHLVAVTA